LAAEGGRRKKKKERGDKGKNRAGVERQEREITEGETARVKK
jgi:hypothetical protein